MDTLHDRLAELADDAPTGGAPAAELWARGKRAHRLRAAALAATLLVVGAVGTGIGVRLADVDGNRSDPAPAGADWHHAADRIPRGGGTAGSRGHSRTAGGDLVDSSRGAGGAPEAVGLVAETGTFGTLPINLLHDDPEGPDSMVVALSPDGRRMAYPSPTGELIVHDLVSGEDILARCRSSRPARGTPGSMPPTSSATLREGPTQTDGCGSRARRRSWSTYWYYGRRVRPGGSPMQGGGPQPCPVRPLMFVADPPGRRPVNTGNIRAGLHARGAGVVRRPGRHRFRDPAWSLEFRSLAW